MSSQVFLFTGENDYELSREKARWIARFREKHGPENLTHLEAKSLSYTEFLDAVSASPFIASNRLVIVDGIPKLEKEQVAGLLSSLHPQTVLLITDPKPDKRLTATKEFLKHAEVKTFAPPERRDLLPWCEQLAREQGTELSSDAAAHLIDVVGEDQMLLANEIGKLATFAFGRTITRDDIDTLVILSVERVGWKLLDLLAEGRRGEATLFARDILEKGEGAYALWNILLWIASQTVLVSAAVRDGQTSPGAIAKTAGVSFSTAKTLARFVRGLRAEELRSVVDRIVDADRNLKTGGYRATAEAPEELNALIDCCIGSFPRS